MNTAETAHAHVVQIRGPNGQFPINPYPDLNLLYEQRPVCRM